MATHSHTALVRVYCGGSVVEPGEGCDYDGLPNWKYKPTASAARAEWEATYADQGRVDDALQGLRPSLADAGKLGFKE